jgi:hypothetical protein
MHINPCAGLGRTMRRATTRTCWRGAQTKRLYYKLLTVGIKPVFLTGRTEDQRAITVANLHRQGFSGWMNLLLKQPGFKGSAVTYKSSERQKMQDAGYVIVANIGDQWSDILGAPEGARTFKLPTPCTTSARPAAIDCSWFVVAAWLVSSVGIN